MASKKHKKHYIDTHMLVEGATKEESCNVFVKGMKNFFLLFCCSKLGVLMVYFIFACR